MKISPKLPGNLRALFGILQVGSVAASLAWILMLASFAWIPNLSNDKPRLLVSVGHVSLQSPPDAIGLKSDTAKPGSLGLVDLQGALQVDLCSEDPALVSALRWTALPSIAVLAAFGWLFFGSLKKLCASIERGNVFSEDNLRLVRGIGWILIGSGVVGVAVGFLASQVMSAYLAHHVVLTGLKTAASAPGGSGAPHFISSAGQVPFAGLEGSC